ncbi:hypothetical protein D3C77_266100 [compost metagenome]
MVAGAQDAGPVQAELDDAPPEPALSLVRIETLRRRDQQGRAPDQQPHVQLGLLPHQGPELMTDFGAPVGQRPLGVQARAGIKLPAEDQDRALGLVQG